jgi:hypothetical protein
MFWGGWCPEVVIDIPDGHDSTADDGRARGGGKGWRMDDTNSVVSLDGLRVLARRDGMIDEAKIEQIQQIQAAMKKQTSDGGKSRASRVSAFAAPPHASDGLTQTGLTHEEQARIAHDITQQVLADRRKKAEYSTFYQEELREAQERTDAAFGGNMPPSPREPVYRPGDDTQNARMVQLTNLARQQVTLEEQQIIESITTMIGMAAQAVEIGANTMDFHMIETQDLSVEVQRAVDNEEFSIALRHMLQQGGGEIFKNPYISLGTLVMSLVMKNHTRIMNAKISGRTPARLKHDAEKLRQKKEEKLEKRRQHAADRQRRLDAEAKRAAEPSIEQKMNTRIDEVYKKMQQDMSQLVTAVNSIVEQRSERSSRRSSRKSSRKSSPRSGSESSESSEVEEQAPSKKKTARRRRPKTVAEETAEAEDDEVIAADDEVIAEADALSEAPTVEAVSDGDDDADSSTSAAPSDDKLINAPVASRIEDAGFARILGNVAPLVEKINESGKREDELAAKTDDLKDRMRRLNLNF